MQKEDQTKARIDIIKAIQTPLGFCTLVVLVSEATLGLLANRASGANLTFLTVGIIIIIVLLIAVVTYLVIKSPEVLTGQETKIETNFKYDLFIASPMAAWASSEQYKHDRSNVLRIAESFRQDCDFKTIFYMGKDIKTMIDFDASDIGAADDLQIVRDSKYYVLLYPKKIASSVLVETGWALALRKPSIYFVRDRKDLPFLLKQVAQVFPFIRIYDGYKSANEVIRLIHRHKKNLFPINENESSRTQFFPAEESEQTHLNIIQSVKSPLSLFALIVLIIEGTLGILASRASGLSFTLLIAGMLLVLISNIGSVVYLALRKPKSLIPHTSNTQKQAVMFSHDVYIASPMAAWTTSEEYEQDRIIVLKIVDLLTQLCGFKSIFYMGKDICSKAYFDAPDVGTTDNTQALEVSKRFILLYPKKVVSSVLVEVGFAIGLNKPSIIFVNHRNDLPFLLRQAEQAFPNVRIYEGYNCVDDVIRIIKSHKDKLFEV